MSGPSQPPYMHDLNSPLEGYMRVLVTQMLVSMARTLRDDHLSTPQLAAVHLLSIHNEMRVGQLAAQLFLPLPAASRMTTEMVKRGLFVRREDESDRRAKIVSLSPAGHALIEAISRRRIEEGAAAMAQGGDAVSGKFLEFFDQLIDSGMTSAPPGVPAQPVPMPGIKPRHRGPKAV